MTRAEQQFLNKEVLDIIEAENLEEHTILPTRSALDEDSRIIVSFTDEAPAEYLDMMKDHIEAFAEELGLDIHIEVE